MNVHTVLILNCLQGMERVAPKIGQFVNGLHRNGVRRTP